MGEFVFSLAPPKWWQELCRQQSMLFSSLEWQMMLEKSFDCRTVYGWNAETETGIVITIFKAGPFRIGYVGFPKGGVLGKHGINEECILAVSKARFPFPLHLLRIPCSSFDKKNVFDLDAVTTPETAIVDLQRWKVSSVPKLSRYVKRANRSGLKVIDASPVLLQGQNCYRLYKETIRRNDGNLRYNKDYFNELIELSHIQSNVRCLLAFLQDELAGFIVIVMHKQTAYYLHGASKVSLRRYCASDRLLFKGIVWAKEMGMNCFNFMASPNDQPSLIRYKEKWGGITRNQYVYELPINPLYAKVFNGTTWCYNHLNKILR